MRRKRLVTILLCMTLAISAFTGCGKKDTVAEAEPETQTEKNYVNSTEFVVTDDTEAVEIAAETETEEVTEITEENKDTKTTDKTDTATSDTASDAAEEVADEPVQEPIVGEYSDVTLIGDSVMLGAADSISSSMPGCVVDAKESRQVKAGIEIAQELEQQGKLNGTVVIALGTNGTFSQETGQALIDYLGTDRNIYWVYAYGVSWQDDSNSVIATLAANNANVTVIDWPAYAAGHSDYFYNDGIHLNGTGRSAYAQMLVDNVTP